MLKYLSNLLVIKILSKRRNPCYVFVQDVKTESNVMREQYLAIFTESASKEEYIYAEEESYQKNINANMGGDIG